MRLACPSMVLTGVTALSLAAGPVAAQSCQKCEFALLSNNRYCMDVVDEETGSTICEAILTQWGIPADCQESGTFCSTSTATGGNGSGGTGSGSGGGGGSCGTTGFCAAECFSCPGGGGRPPV